MTCIFISLPQEQTANSGTNTGETLNQLRECVRNYEQFCFSVCFFPPDCLWASPLHCTPCRLPCHRSSPTHTSQLSSGSHGHRSLHTGRQNHTQTQKSSQWKLSQTLSKYVKVDISDGASSQGSAQSSLGKPLTCTLTHIWTHAFAYTSRVSSRPFTQFCKVVWPH